MSEWDYLPTPYETLVENETKHSLLIMMSIGCLLEGKVIHPIDVFEIAKHVSVAQIPRKITPILTIY